MYLVMKGVFVCKEFDVISNGQDHHEFDDIHGGTLSTEVSDIAKEALLGEDTTYIISTAWLEWG